LFDWILAEPYKEYLADPSKFQTTTGGGGDDDGQETTQEVVEDEPEEEEEADFGAGGMFGDEADY